MRRALAGAILLAAAAFSAVIAGAFSAPLRAADRATATIAPERATFTFPVPTRKTWEWNVSGTPANNVEYQWTVEVVNGGQEFEFGLVLLRAADAPKTRGDLASLVRAGRQIVTTSTDPHHASSVIGARLKFTVDDATLIVAVDDPDTLARLFSHRPASATFRTRRPGAAPTRQTIKILYQN